MEGPLCLFVDDKANKASPYRKFFMVPHNKGALSLLSCRMSLAIYMSVSRSEVLRANMFGVTCDASGELLHFINTALFRTGL